MKSFHLNHLKRLSGRITAEHVGETATVETATGPETVPVTGKPPGNRHTRRMQAAAKRRAITQVRNQVQKKTGLPVTVEVQPDGGFTVHIGKKEG
jgi:hypothetical protein